MSQSDQPQFQQSQFQQSPTRPAEPKKRSKTPIVIVVVIVLVIAAVVGADRITHHLAEQRVASSLQTRLNTADEPQVTIDGIPFLTQLAGRHYDQVEIHADDVPAAAGGLALDTLDATLYDVKADSGYSTLTIARIDGTANFGYDSLSTAIGQTVSYAGKNSSGQDQVKLTVSGAVFGQTLTATVTGAVGLDVADQGISIVDPAVTVAGVSIPANTASQLIAQLVPPITVKDLPLGVQLQSLDITGSGVSADVSAQDVTVQTK